MAITSGEARLDFNRLIERVNRPEIEIVSKHGTAVLMSKDEFDALVETNNLLSCPANAHRLMSALESVRDVESAEHRVVGSETAHRGSL